MAGGELDGVSRVMGGMEDGACVIWVVNHVLLAPGVPASHPYSLRGVMSRPCWQKLWRAGRASACCGFALAGALRCPVVAADLGEIPLVCDDPARYSEALLTTHYYQKSQIRRGLGWGCNGAVSVKGLV